MPKSKPPKEKILRITLIKSAIGYSERHKATVRALGLHRMNDTVEHIDKPTLQGMIAIVRHLVEVETVEDTKA